jgi:hypothetical protein
VVDEIPHMAGLGSPADLSVWECLHSPYMHMGDLTKKTFSHLRNRVSGNTSSSDGD